MTESKTYLNAYELSTNEVTWHTNTDLVTLEGSVVIVNDEPLIKVFGKNKASSPQNERVYTLQELWELESQLLINPYGGVTELFGEVTKRRGEYGQKVILQVWESHGYAARDFVKESIPTEPYPLLRKLIPALKVPSKNKTSKSAYTGILTFQNKGHESFWAITIKENGTQLLQAPWNDYAGITELANNVLDSEYVGVLLNLGNPNGSIALAERKKAIDENKISRGYFKSAIFSAKERKEILEINENYRKDLNKAIENAFSHYNTNNLSHGLGSVANSEVSLFKLTRASTIAYQSIFDLYSYNKVYENSPQVILDEIANADELLWSTYKKALEDLGFTLIVDPNSYYSTTRLNARGLSYQMFNFHSLIIVKDETQYLEYLAHNSDDHALYLHVQGKLED